MGAIERLEDVAMNALRTIVNAHRAAPSAWIAVSLAMLSLFIPACSGRATGGSVAVRMMAAPSLVGSVVPNEPEQPVLIYLPPGYDDGDRRYVVLYYLPGFSTEVTEYVDGTLDGWSLTDALDRGIVSGALREMIVVIVQGRNRLGGSFYVDSPVSGGWESFVTEDVVDYVDRRYRTVAGPAGRAIAGDSMGGFGALRLAMRRPDLFSVVYALSPGLFDEGVDVVEQWLAPRTRVQAMRWWQDRLQRFPPDESHSRLLELIDDLRGSGRRFNYYLAFLWAYAAAFAPSGCGSGSWWMAPAVDPVQETAWRSCLATGFGAWDERVKKHLEGLRRIHGVGLDCGRNDRLTWIPAGCEAFGALLAADGIEHELRWHDGGHIDRLAERLENEALPFVSDHFAQEGRAR